MSTFFLSFFLSFFLFFSFLFFSFLFLFFSFLFIFIFIFFSFHFSHTEVSSVTPAPWHVLVSSGEEPFKAAARGGGELRDLGLLSVVRHMVVAHDNTAADKVVVVVCSSSSRMICSSAMCSVTCSGMCGGWRIGCEHYTCRNYDRFAQNETT